MIELLQKYGPLLWENTYITLLMVAAATLFAYVFGLPMGVLLKVTDRGGIMENRAFNSAFGWIVNILRSLPFVILMVALIPLTRLIVGKAIGPAAACVPLIIAAAPFVARLVESSLSEIDNGVIEAAKCMGATNWQIITRVLLVESVPSLLRGLSITIITIFGYTAVTGAVGAGGLGNIAFRFGYQRYQTDVMYATVVLVVILVCIIQSVCSFLARKSDKRNR